MNDSGENRSVLRSYQNVRLGWKLWFFWVFGNVGLFGFYKTYYDLDWTLLSHPVGWIISLCLMAFLLTSVIILKRLTGLKPLAPLHCVRCGRNMVNFFGPDRLSDHCKECESD